jgi:hypothetical protein
MALSAASKTGTYLGGIRIADIRVSAGEQIPRLATNPHRVDIKDVDSIKWEMGMSKGIFRDWRNMMIRMTRLIALLTFAFPVVAKTHAQSNASFATPEYAVQALLRAAENDDTAALLKLFGPGGQDVFESGDPAEDNNTRAEFARLAHDKIRINIDSTNPDKATFSIGQEGWPFPVPLVRRNGNWEFDSAQGRVEILAHRIGENELDVIEVCRGFVEAQFEYASEDRGGTGTLAYAQKVMSSPGKRDGLYWEGTPGSLVAKAFAQATIVSAMNSKKPAPYHGYYFRLLKSQGADVPSGAFDYVVDGNMIGGFALVAWPAEYAVSGIQTFIVSHEGIVYQKDLGLSTATLGIQMNQFNPDKSWRQVAD